MNRIIGFIGELLWAVIIFSAGFCIGSTYTLQEILTTKSDDIDGRTKLYNSLVRGKNTPESSIPESFNVLVKELEGLGLNVVLN